MSLQFHRTHGDSVCKPYQSVQSVSQLFDSRNSILNVKSTFLHRFPSTELTVPKNTREYCLQTLQFSYSILTTPIYIFTQVPLILDTTPRRMMDTTPIGDARRTRPHTMHDGARQTRPPKTNGHDPKATRTRDRHDPGGVVLKRCVLSLPLFRRRFV